MGGNIKEIRWEGLELIGRVEDREKWCTVVDAIMNRLAA
jgi:hypothetical protein